MLSIESQIKELGQLCDRLGIAPEAILTESKSAKSPGRTVFSELMKRISAGEVKAVICWKLDRLARNPVDGSALVWALDQGKLAEIITPHGTFHDNSNDKFLMQIEFGMAKKYVDDLSDNVKRGNRAKLEKGWLPHRPPLGYLNEPVDRTIVPDPERYHLIQRMWNLLLQGVSPQEILRRATNKWGLRTRKTHRMGGGPVSCSGIYSIFSNPFYYGLLETRAGVFQGKHQAMVTEDEYWRAQSLLGRKGRPRPKTHQFAFTGMIRCGKCGGMITAEEKVNRYGAHYVYYHCTKKDRLNPCREKYVNVIELEKQISRYLSEIHVPECLLEIGMKCLADETAVVNRQQGVIKATLEQTLNATLTKITKLNHMRLNDLLTDEEYVHEKTPLLREKLRLEKALRNSARAEADASQSAAEVLTFGNTAAATFQNGTLDAKRGLLENIGSNSSIYAKKLNIEAKKPFIILENGLRELQALGGPFEPSFSSMITGQNALSPAMISQWQATVNDVRTYFLKHGTDRSKSTST